MAIVAADRDLVIELAKRLIKEKVPGAQLATALGAKAAPALRDFRAAGSKDESEETDLMRLESVGSPTSGASCHQDDLKEEALDDLVA